MTALAKFERHDVLGSGMEIPGAAGGLREPLKLDPIELKLEEVCYVTMKLKVNRIRFDPVKDSDGGLTRVHSMEVVEAAFVPKDIAEEQLSETRARLEEKRALDEAAAGTPQLPLGGTTERAPRKTAEQRLAEDAARPFDPTTVPAS